MTFFYFIFDFISVGDNLRSALGDTDIMAEAGERGTGSQRDGDSEGLAPGAGREEGGTPPDPTHTCTKTPQTGKSIVILYFRPGVGGNGTGTSVSYLFSRFDRGYRWILYLRGPTGAWSVVLEVMWLWKEGHWKSSIPRFNRSASGLSHILPL